MRTPETAHSLATMPLQIRKVFDRLTLLFATYFACDCS